MRRHKLPVWLPLVLALSLASSGCSLFAPARRFGGGGTSGPSAGPSSGMKVLVFYDQSKTVSGSLMPLISQNRASISDLAPLWYSVDANGNITSKSDTPVLDFTRRNHIPLEPLVNNAKGTSAFLTNPAARRRAVTNLVHLVASQRFDGLNIDFELLKSSARSGLSSFMKDLYSQLHPKGKLLSIDIIPAGKASSASKSAYNYSALAHSADDIVLMTYDAHDNGSKPGPVAPLAWVTQRLKLALRLGIPADRILLGLADYGYDWPQGSTKAKTVGLKTIEARGITPTRTSDGSPHYTYTLKGTKHIVWYEDQVSVVPKIRLAMKYHLRGLALWRAGYETAAYWSAIRSTLGSGGAAPGGGTVPGAGGKAPAAGGTVPGAGGKAPAGGTVPGTGGKAPAAGGTTQGAGVPAPAGGTATAARGTGPVGAAGWTGGGSTGAS